MNRKMWARFSFTVTPGPLLLPCFLLMVAASLPVHGALATHVFSGGNTGTYPNTLTLPAGQIRVDLSALRGATNAVVYRAILNPDRDFSSPRQNDWADQKMVIRSVAGDTLEVRAPRYRTLDATLAVQQAMASGVDLVLTVVNSAGIGSDFSPGTDVSLEVFCDRALPGGRTLPTVTGAAARFKDGDTMITFSEVNSPITENSVTCSQFHAIRSNMDQTQRVRYRVYRSPIAIAGEAQLAAAVLVDEIPSLSVWDINAYGEVDSLCNDARPVPRYPVDDLVLGAPGTGIYVNRFKGSAPESAYYLVSRAVNGEESLSFPLPGGNRTAAVAESPGYGMAVKRVEERPSEFLFVRNPVMNYYVKWEAPPACNVPSRPYDYLVGVPNVAAPAAGRPVHVGLHSWGANLNGGYGWWYRNGDGSLLVTTNQSPYDWWTAYNENLGTIKSQNDAVIRPYTQVRVLSFLKDFVERAYPVDANRILLGGVSMGGSGTSMWGIRSGHIFTHLASWVGVHIPAETPGYFTSFEGVFGRRAWNTRYANDGLVRFGYPEIRPQDNVSVWDYWDNDQWLRANPTAEVPWFSYSNGKNDGGIGWPQAWKNTGALVDTKRPFNFSWGQQGHGQRAVLVDGGDSWSNLDFRLDQSLPAFSNASLNDNLGATSAEGADTGQINNHFRWDTSNVTDEAGRWEMSIRLVDGAPQNAATADVTPRRLQRFRPTPTAIYTWSLDGAVQGTVTADANGLVTLPSVPFTKTYRRVSLVGGGSASLPARPRRLRAR